MAMLSTIQVNLVFAHKQLTFDETTNNMRLKPGWLDFDEDVGSLGMSRMRSRKIGCGKTWATNRPEQATHTHTHAAMETVHAPLPCQSYGLVHKVARGGSCPGRLLHMFPGGVMLLVLAVAHLAGNDNTQQDGRALHSLHHTECLLRQAKHDQQSMSWRPYSFGSLCHRHPAVLLHPARPQSTDNLLTCGRPGTKKQHQTMFVDLRTH
jgi:hypothetical protein